MSLPSALRSSRRSKPVDTAAQEAASPPPPSFPPFLEGALLWLAASAAPLQQRVHHKAAVGGGGGERGRVNLSTRTFPSPALLCLQDTYSFAAIVDGRVET